ncbi:MAG: hypothetical protein ACE5HT_04795 [Gemmatimonadales bacterium]
MENIVPSADRIDRAALQRIIQRAAELQAQERDLGEDLTESELLQLGEEVGISSTHLRKALEEERSQALARAGSSKLAWLLGPRRIAAHRIVPGRREDLAEALYQWLTHGELLQVKRRYPDRRSWERKGGTLATLQRSLGFSGNRFLLSRAREVGERVVQIDKKQCHVELTADIANTFNAYLAGCGTVVGGGAATTGIALAIGVMAPVAVVPVLIGLPIAVATARSRRSHVDRLRVALEQILDRLEHGELDARPGSSVSAAGAVGRIASEIRKNLGV